MCVLMQLLISTHEVFSVKPHPTATRPPTPPPPPPILLFANSFENPRVDAIYEMIAPTHMQSGLKPSLSIYNPDYNVVGSSGYRPRPQNPQRPHRPQQQPLRPQQQPLRPQQQPLRPRPFHPSLPFSQVLARPPVKIPPKPAKPPSQVPRPPPRFDEFGFQTPSPFATYVPLFN
ncbi:extensin-like [Homalodisca vitripennis]|uniref:extensin-like n=1 Tax=Homalodisca vitripennis TaxID=197043 RepID=UPI001EEB77D8|nr:extensin-like [Homalodisca vitripennis]